MMPDANPYVGKGFVSKLRTCSRTALRQWHNARMCTHVRDERGPLGWALRSYRRRRDCHPLKPTWTGYRPGIVLCLSLCHPRGHRGRRAVRARRVSILGRRVRSRAMERAKLERPIPGSKTVAPSVLRGDIRCVSLSHLCGPRRRCLVLPFLLPVDFSTFALVYLLLDLWLVASVVL